MSNNPNRSLLTGVAHYALFHNKKIKHEIVQKMAIESKSTKTIIESWADINKRKTRLAQIHQAVLRTKIVPQKVVD